MLKEYQVLSLLEKKAKEARGAVDKMTEFIARPEGCVKDLIHSAFARV